FSIHLGAPQVIIGVLVALYSLFPMILAIYAGKLTDRLGVRWPMVAGSCGIALGLTLPYLFPSTTTLYFQATLVGAAHVFYNVSVQNLIGSIGTPEERTKNYSNFGLAMATGSLLGPLISGFGIDHFGHARSYLLIAAFPLITAAIMASAKQMTSGRGRGTHKAEAAQAKDDGAAPSQPFELFFANRPLRRVLITSAVILTGIDLFHFYMPIYGHSIGLSASQIGVVLSMFAAASFVVRIWMPAIVRYLGEERVLIMSMAVAAITYLAVPYITQIVILSLVAFMLGLGTGCGQPLSLTLIYGRAPEGRSGEALGLRLTLNNFTHMVTPLLFGAIGTAFGVAPVFWCNSLMLAGGGMIIRRK
ncbi:MAG TPA: MFS transporter, partial [Burkholderiales bacterium]|nr:MFS transporter [Burkholderiales bacterium]